MLFPCLVFQEKSDVQPDIPPTLDGGRDADLKIAANVGAVKDRFGVQNIVAESKL